MYHHAGRLVDRDYIVILIEDFERQILGYRAERRQVGGRHMNLLRSLQQIRALSRNSVHLHAALIDPCLQARPAVLRKLIVEKLVQALAGVGG